MGLAMSSSFICRRLGDKKARPLMRPEASGAGFFGEGVSTTGAAAGAEKEGGADGVGEATVRCCKAKTTASICSGLSTAWSGAGWRSPRTLPNTGINVSGRRWRGSTTHCFNCAAL
jgi:hypothetical protein